MYAFMTVRKTDSTNQQERKQRGEKELFPMLHKAPGFVAFYVVQETPEQALSITVFETQAQAEAFLKGLKEWQQSLSQMGAPLVSSSAGEVIAHTTAHK
jgi:heme-degrading monooxygenase HmoA